MRREFFADRRPTLLGVVVGLVVLLTLLLVFRLPTWASVGFLLIGAFVAVQRVYSPVLVVADDWLEHRSYQITLDRWYGIDFFGHAARSPVRRVVGAEIESLAWGEAEYADNIGLRMRDGSMEYVSVYRLAAFEREEARRAVLEFAARFTRDRGGLA